MLTDLIRLPIIPRDPRFEVEDIYSGLSTLFPNDVQTQHGDAGSYVIYKSTRLGDLELRLTDPTAEDDRFLFAHSVWNASVQMAEYVSGCSEGLSAAERKAWDVAGKTVLELGTGLAGIASALSGANEVVISDYPSPELLTNINNNVLKNVPAYIWNKNEAYNLQPRFHQQGNVNMYDPPQRLRPNGVDVHSHKWGRFADTFSQNQAKHFTRILAADCLWMDGEHQSLVDSILHFLSPAPDTQAWVIAGFHTGRAKVAAFLLTATMFYLVQHPTVLEKLQADLRASFPILLSIQPVAAENHRYLRACMDEAMRLSPPAPTNIPRVVGQGGIKVVNEHLSENVYVGVPNFSIFRDEHSFAKPHDFIPERWILDPANGVSEESVKQAHQAFQSFSLGPRHCIGKHLAMKEVSFILATLLWLFEVDKIEGSGLLHKHLPGVNGKVVMEQSDVYTSLEEGPEVKLRLRGDMKL